MGQAKLRGTFEQRKAAAIERDTREREWREKERAMTPIKRERLRKSQLAFAQILAISALSRRGF